MDSRDSSSASRDGDEDGLISITAELAKEAAVLFQSRRYSECIDVLQQLLQKKKDDPKVLHNVIVAEYFRDGCSDPRKVLEMLNEVKKRSDDLARASSEQGEAPGNHGNSASSGSKGSGALHVSASNTGIAYIDEYDISVATLNIAVVLFHLQEYASALSILEPLYQNIEPIDETTALHICLLLLDVALASRDTIRAADVLQYLEKAFGVGFMTGTGQGDNGSASQSQYSHPPAKASSTPINSTSLDISNSDSPSNTSENALVRTLSDENYENLLSTLDIGGQNLVRPPGFSSNDLSKASVDRSVPALDLKLKLHLYKVRLLILARNLKAAKREVKLAMNIARGRESSTALLLKSQLEYARGNHRKAIKLLITSSNLTEAGITSIFNNDLGCIYHQLRKHHSSTVLFSKALKSSLCFRSEKPLKLSAFAQDKSLLIMYNCGLQYLICGKPVVAAHCFQKAGQVFFNQPLLWLRIAECYLLALEKGLLESPKVPDNEEVRVHVAGTGKWRQLVVEDGKLRNRHLENVEGTDGLAGAAAQQKLSLPFARQCLLNALHLLNKLESKSLKGNLPCAEEDVDPSQRDSNQKNMSQGDSNASNQSSQANANGDAKESKSVLNVNTTLQSSVNAYQDICKSQNHMIKQSVLADLAYVELTLENPMKALSAAKSLLRLQDCSRIFIFLGHMYAAEALCRLNRPKEAVEHLLIYVADGINVNYPYTEEDGEKWRGEKSMDGEEVSGGSVTAKHEPAEDFQGTALPKPAEAVGSLYVNLAAMFGMQGNLDQAHQFASKALSVMPKSRQAILTAVYVDILRGKSHEAVVKLKECSRVRFFPSGVTLHNSS